MSVNHRVKNNIFYNINLINERLSQLEVSLANIDARFQQMIDIERTHLIRVKNNEDVSNDTIYYGCSYNDLSPTKAFKAYSRQDYNFILLDVSAPDFLAPCELAEAIKIPLSELEQRANTLLNKKIPILVISEDGTSSILACELLSQMGFYNTSNISGGYKFWPANALNAQTSQSKVS
jgi:rhodanese-related sulfurtransferase